MLSARTVSRIQGWFYLASGAWPLIHEHSFQLVTGFKTTFWLAQLVGSLLALLGGVLVWTARRGPLSPEMRTMGVGTAAILLVTDLVCVPLPETTRIYWLDALAEGALIILWLRARRQ